MSRTRIALARILEMTDGRGVDVVLDCTGGGGTAPTLLGIEAAKRRGATMVVQGEGNQEFPHFPIGRLTRKGMTLKSARGHSHRAVELALHQLASHRFPLGLMMTHTIRAGGGGLRHQVRWRARGAGRHPRVGAALEVKPERARPSRSCSRWSTRFGCCRARTSSTTAATAARGATRESFYINSAASTRSALTIADIVAVDLDGQLVEGSARPPFEFHIHSEIYRVRPDVHAVMHTHPRWSTFLTMVGANYRAVCAQGALLGEIPLLDSPLSVNTERWVRRSPPRSVDGPAVLLKSHGAVVVGADIVECFALAAYLEENAYRQYMAMQIGAPYVFSDVEQQAYRERLWTPQPVQEDLGPLPREGLKRHAWLGAPRWTTIASPMDVTARSEMAPAARTHGARTFND